MGHAEVQTTKAQACQDPDLARRCSSASTQAPGPLADSAPPPRARLWEPYDGRLSRTVLRAPEDETPSGDSPRAPRSRLGWPRIPVSTCTTRRPIPAGSIKSNDGSPTSPRTSYVAAHRSVQAGKDICYWITTWNETSNRSFGPRQPNRSSTHSDDFLNDLAAENTRHPSALSEQCAGRAVANLDQGRI